MRWLGLVDALLLENGFAPTELMKRARNAEEALNHIKSFISFSTPCLYTRKNHIETQDSSFSGVSEETEWRVPGYPLQR